MKLIVNDDAGILYSYTVKELKHGIIHVKINGFDSNTCEYWEDTRQDMMYFYDEQSSYNKASVQLVLVDKNIETCYYRYDSYRSGSYEYIYVPIEYFT